MRYDLVIIGSGPAGEKAAMKAAYFGKKVAVVERDLHPGGACAHTGTLPSKTLRETALFLSGYHARELYGLGLELDPSTEVHALMTRKSAICAAASNLVRTRLEQHKVDLLHGDARFVDAHALEVRGEQGISRVESDFFLIATGSSPVRPADIDFPDPDIYDSDEILGLDRLPKTLTILGGGVIGCEYAAMFAALQVKVTLVDAHPEVLTFLDAELVADLRGAMERLGVRFALGHKWNRVARSGDKIQVELSDGSRLESDKLLYAAGRSGNTKGLGLETLGLTPDARGTLAVDTHYRTAVPHVYAAGDVIGFPALASTSMEQGRIAACHALSLHANRELDHLLPYGIYTIPELSAVGETEQSARKKNLPVVVGRSSFRDLPRGQIAGDTDGKTKLVISATDRRVLGVHVLGERAGDLVHIGQAVMHAGGTVDVFIDMVFNFPTLAESYKYAAYDALRALEQPAASGPGSTAA